MAGAHLTSHQNQLSYMPGVAHRVTARGYLPSLYKPYEAATRMFNCLSNVSKAKLGKSEPKELKIFSNLAINNSFSM